MLNRSRTAGAELSGEVITLDSVADNPTLDLTTFADGQQISIRCYHPDTTLGGDIFYVDKSRPKTAHNSGSVISPTVPWDGSATELADFLNRKGETDPTGTG